MNKQGVIETFFVLGVLLLIVIVIAILFNGFITTLVPSIKNIANPEFLWIIGLFPAGLVVLFVLYAFTKLHT